MSGILLMGVRPRTRHALSIIRVTPTATPNSLATPSGLWRLEISQQGRNSLTTMSTRSMTSPQSPAIVARSIVVAISWVRNIGIVSRKEHLAGVLRISILPSSRGISLQVPQGKISRLGRGDVADVHVSTPLRLARALVATINDLLRDCQDAHEDMKVSS